METLLSSILDKHTFLSTRTTLFTYMVSLRASIEKISTSPRNYWFGLSMNILVGISLIIYGLYHLPSYLLLILIPIGFFGFSLLEYIFHRWVFHTEKSPAYKNHTLHHTSPERLLGLPWFFTQLVVLLLMVIFSALINLPSAALIVGSMLLGYAYYGGLHHLQHHKKAFTFKHFRKMHALHNAHHKLQNYNYGVTTSFWDHVFRTHQKYYKKEP